MPKWAGTDSPPVSIHYESGGDGDDLKVTFADGSIVMLQAKRGLKNSKRLREALDPFIDSLRPGERAVLCVDRERSSEAVRITLKESLERWTTGLFVVPAKLSHAERLGTRAAAPLRGRFAIAVVQLDDLSESDANQAEHLLERVVGATQARAAFRILSEDAVACGAHGDVRNRQGMLAILKVAQIEALADPDVARAIELARGHQSRSLLRFLELRPSNLPPGPDEMQPARLTAMRATGLMQENRDSEAIAILKPLHADYPRYLPAVVRLAVASHRVGDADAAEHFSRLAIEIDPAAPESWAVYLRFSRAEGALAEVPPPLVNDIDVLTALAENQLIAGNAARAAEIARRCLEQGSPTLDHRFLLAQCLSSIEDQTGLEESLSLSAAVAEELHGSGSALEGYSAMLAAHAARALGRDADELSGLQRAKAVDATRTLAIFDLAQHYLFREPPDPKAALVELGSYVDGERVATTALRARAQFLIGDRVAADESVRAARATYDALLTSRLEDGVVLGGTLLRMGAPDAAAAVLEAVPAPDADERVYAQRAQASIALGNADEAVRLYEQALAVSGQTSLASLRREFAAFLRSLRRPHDALRVLDGEDTVGDEASAWLATMCSFEAGEHLRAERTAEPWASDPRRRKWALRVLASIATDRLDRAAAIRLLERWCEVDNSAEPRLYLSQAYLAGDDVSAAKALLQAVNSSALTVEGRLDFAALLGRAGLQERAYSEAYGALRTAPLDADVQLRWLQVSLLLRDVRPTEHLDVAEGATVELQRDTGERDFFTLTASPEPQPALDEVDIHSDIGRRVAGRRVGDSIELRGDPTPIRATVVAIHDRYSHAIRLTSARFTSRNPTSREFQSVPVPEAADGSDLSKVFAWAEHNAKTYERVRAAYRANPLVPLGAVAHALRKSVPEAYALVIDGNDGRLHVDGGPSRSFEPDEGQRYTVVISQSAFVTLDELGLLQSARDHVDCAFVTPLLVDGLRGRLRELREASARGSLSMDWRDGPRFHRLEPEQARELAQKRAAVLDWVADQCTETPRPHDWSKSHDEFWQTVDQESFDAALLARERGAVLLSDDLGLRFVAHTHWGVRSLSTIALLQRVLHNQTIDRAAFDEAACRLLALRHWFVPVSFSMLQHALATVEDPASGALAAVLDHLRDPDVTLDGAAQLAAFGLRELVLATLVLPTTSQTIEGLLEALFVHRPEGATRVALERAISAQFYLLPVQKRKALTIVDLFLRSRRGQLPS